LITNGSIFNKEIERFIKDYIDEIVISLDSLKKERFEQIRGINKLNEVKKNITRIVKTKKKVTINFTIFKENLEDFQKIIGFMKENKIRYINILRQRNLGRSVETVRIDKILSLYKGAIKIARKEKIFVGIHDPLINRLGIKNHKTICNAGKTIIAIDVNFNFKPCPFIDNKIKGEFREVWHYKLFKNTKKCV